MKLWVGVTDEDWFSFLKSRNPDEVNFWQPSGNKPPKRFEAGEAFLTVSSPYDTPARYADAFRVMGKDGTVFGERKLLHDHANEQPFTRDLHGVRIPPGTRVVVIQARDQRYGYGGKTVEVVLSGR